MRSSLYKFSFFKFNYSFLILKLSICETSENTIQFTKVIFPDANILYFNKKIKTINRLLEMLHLILC